MAEPSSASVLLVGGPDSGKSNFLFRIWLAISAGKDFLKGDGLPDQLEYLKSGARELLSGDFAQHTPHEVYNESIIPVQVSIKGEVHRGRLVMPDCWGERWVTIYRKREWSTRWEEHIGEQTGCLLFVRASSDQLVSPLDWIQCEQRWSMVIGEGELSAEPPLPTQVILTEWLQFLRTAFREKVQYGVKSRVGIVISAWDKVPTDTKLAGPLMYVRAEFPLLYQFVMTNQDEFDFEIFGVTIAGGDLQHEPGFKEKCLDQADPLSGGYIAYDGNAKVEQSSDLTVPVAWAMGLYELRRG